MKTRQLPAIIVPIIVIPVSIILLIMGYFNFKNISYMKNNGIKTEAVIMDVDKRTGRTGSNRRITYTAHVKFVTKDDKEVNVWHEHNGQYSKSDINKNVWIYYDPANPDKIIWENESGTIMYFIVGTLFLTAGIFVSKHMYVAARKKKRLLAIDYRVMADIYDISKKKDKTKPGEIYDFFIHASYTEGGKKYDFHSKKLDFDPSAFLNTKVPVYVDPHNYTDYYIDIDSLINSARL